MFSINEQRVERIPIGNAEKLKHCIPLWKQSIPQIQLDGGSIRSVEFPDLALPPILPAALPVPGVPPLSPLEEDFLRNPGTFKIDQVYIGDIPTINATKNGETFLIGYLSKDQGFSSWSFAPLQNGTVPQMDGNSLYRAFFHFWKNKPQVKGDGLFAGPVDQGRQDNGVNFYGFGQDRKGRNYFLIHANDGWVPVRHPTDPTCGNWLSKMTLTKIIYDSGRMRWPGCEYIDYRKHGFVSMGENHKIWWPIKNGAFVPSFLRISEPYYADYRKLGEEDSKTWRVAQFALAMGLAYMGYRGTQQAASAAIAVLQSFQATTANLGPNEMERVANLLQGTANLNRYEAFMNGLGAAGNGIQMLGMLNRGGNPELQRLRAEKECATQKDVLTTLEMQDLYDRGEEVVKAVEVGNLPLVQELLNDQPIPPELRYQAIVVASAIGYSDILKALIDQTDIEAPVLKTAEIRAKENDHNAVQLVLKKHRNRDRAVPR
ncbi:MAG: hypothetical protein KGJ02_03560 [Verrucomicrobiota bacterium]|nr:hypothetical protein [Verrucomicrobiota bacterium]